MRLPNSKTPSQRALRSHPPRCHLLASPSKQSPPPKPRYPTPFARGSRMVSPVRLWLVTLPAIHAAARALEYAWVAGVTAPRVALLQIFSRSSMALRGLQCSVFDIQRYPSHPGHPNEKHHVMAQAAHAACSNSKPLSILSLQYAECVYTLPCLTRYSTCIALRV